MIAEDDWREIAKRIEVQYDFSLHPIPESTLDSYERKHSIVLPKSYRAYCQVFGPGHFEYKERFGISVPGYSGTCEMFSIDYLNEHCKSASDFQQVFRESGEYARFERLICFGDDDAGAFHLFDPHDKTPHDECAVYGWSPSRALDCWISRAIVAILGSDQPLEKVQRLSFAMGR